MYAVSLFANSPTGCASSVEETCRHSNCDFLLRNCVCAVHDILGLKGTEFQSLYHFTVGIPVVDKRILSLPAYPGPATDA
jgi:hypothetical protein